MVDTNSKSQNDEYQINLKFQIPISGRFTEIQSTKLKSVLINVNPSLKFSIKVEKS